MNIEDNVPKITPKIIAKEKLRMLSPPNINIHNNTNNVDRTRLQNNILAKEKINAGRVIVGSVQSYAGCPGVGKQNFVRAHQH